MKTLDSSFLISQDFMRPEMTSKWKSNREKNKKIVGKPLTFAIAKLVERAITF